ncbi:peptidylprolyl isomerase [Helicobacter mesocricetorum]|uniref:peptidylprolyl isomerase n=1 Tax=Helicobacter mesocricetorum TaxID=87012 RepID=UPI000CF0356F|nr:peptidylprolyl isomerase [Helicobacter mesocricetorum]
MIGFMQKHKKYFIITVWISTIAFVGAGFVGWGSYNFSLADNNVAIVGDTKISFERMQREYARLYNIYNQLMGGSLDEEQAKKMGIEEQAINNLIVNALMLNYAYDLGLRVSKAEIIEEITSMDAFKNDEVFDEQLYKNILEENRLRPKDFEESVQESLLLQKLNALLDMPLTPLEEDMLKAAYFVEDWVQIKVLDKKDIRLIAKEEEIKKYWEENQDIYQTQRGYEISSVSVNIKDINYNEEEIKKYYEDFKNQFLNEEGQILSFLEAKNRVIEAYKDSQAQKEALKEYISLRKGENQKAKNSIVYEGDDYYGIEFISSLSQANEKETLKPIKVNDSYITAELLKIIPSQSKTYEEAKNDAKEDYVNFEKSKILEENAKKELVNFKGIDVGYLGKDVTRTLKGLDENESKDFINQLFSVKKEKGYILLTNKAVLYQILRQRVKKSDIISHNLEFLIQNGIQVKGRLVESEFLEYLSKLYKVVRNSKS